MNAPFRRQRPEACSCRPCRGSRARSGWSCSRTARSWSGSAGPRRPRSPANNTGLLLPRAHRARHGHLQGDPEQGHRVGDPGDLRPRPLLPAARGPRPGGTWHADSFYSFWQDVNTEDSFWSEDSYTEITSSSRGTRTRSPRRTSSLVADPGLSAEQQAEFDSWVHELITKQLEEGVKRNLLQAVADVDPNVTAWTDGQDIEDVHREVTNTQISDVRVEWSEAKAIVRTIHPQGMLPTVTSLKGPDGQPLKWEDYYSKISVDEFLRTLRLSVRVRRPVRGLRHHARRGQGPLPARRERQDRRGHLHQGGRWTRRRRSSSSSRTGSGGSSGPTPSTSRATSHRGPRRRSRTTAPTST